MDWNFILLCISNVISWCLIIGGSAIVITTVITIVAIVINALNDFRKWLERKGE